MSYNGGPAFPSPPNSSMNMGTGAVTQHQSYSDGMTLRDYFAGQALAGMMAIPGNSQPERDAKYAYELADAMIKAREAT